jgi:hypothetical protein
MRLLLSGGARGPVAEVVTRVRDQLVASYDHTDHMMRRATRWNDFWPTAPRRLVRPRLAQWLAALAPPPGDRRVLVAVNVMPEVYRVDPPPAGEVRLTRARALPQMLRPGDLRGGDALLDRTLQIHVTRVAHDVTVNLYGGGMHQRGLDEVADHIAMAAAEVA